MGFILCSVAFVICLAVQVGSQLPPKRIGEWHFDRFEMYPNPWRNSSECRTPETSGLCDYNEIITPEQRKDFIEQPEINTAINADGCLCNKSCAEIRIIVTVAIMKKIGPQISDYRAAAKVFAEKFRANWTLNHCSVILIASKGDNLCFLDAGSDVIKLLPTGRTEQIDRDINNNSCSNGSIVDGINEMLKEYRKALAAAKAAAKAAAEAAAAQTTAPTPALTPETEANGGSTAIIVGIIVGVLVVVIVVIIIIIIVKKRKRSLEEITTPKPLPHGGKAKEEEHLNSTPKDV